ncbi:MAG: glycosyltransferase, partial [Planococcus donghaensis]
MKAIFRKKVLILSNHFITLYNFRRELIETLIENGHDIYISMPKAEENIFFENIGCNIIETPVSRRGLNPIQDLKLLFKYIKIMKELKPNLVLSYTIKPNIYGSFASNITKYKQIVNITGTGGTFLKKTFISTLITFLYKISIKKSYKV